MNDLPRDPVLPHMATRLVFDGKVLHSDGEIERITTKPLPRAVLDQAGFDLIIEAGLGV